MKYSIVDNSILTLFFLVQFGISILKFVLYNDIESEHLTGTHAFRAVLYGVVLTFLASTYNGIEERKLSISNNEYFNSRENLNHDIDCLKTPRKTGTMEIMPLNEYDYPMTKTTVKADVHKEAIYDENYWRNFRDNFHLKHPHPILFQRR